MISNPPQKTPPSPLLCIDTSAQFCTVGVVDTAHNNTVLSQIQTPMDRGHAEHIMPHITDCLTQANLTVSQLGGVAVTVGAGTFTGIRIAIATAQGLCLPHKIPCIGVSVAHALITHTQGQNVLIVGETKRPDFYIAPYLNGTLGNDQSLTADQIIAQYYTNTTTPPNIMGNGAERLYETLSQTLPTPPKIIPTVPALSVIDIATSAIINPLPATPLYARSPDVQPPKSGIIPQNIPKNTP